MSKRTSIFIVAILMLLLACGEKKDKTTPQSSQTDEQPTLKSAESEQKSDKKTILFFGNSLTAGYGLDKEQSFPSLIQDRIDSLGMDYAVINGGLSGETSSGGKERISWVLRTPVDIFVLELGANDMLRALDLSETKKNLRAILDAVLAKNSETKILLAGILAPPNMGPDYVKRFDQIYPDLADEYNAPLIPFLLDGVAGNPELNLEDAKHPNAKGQKIVADNVWQYLQPLLQ